MGKSHPIALRGRVVALVEEDHPQGGRSAFPGVAALREQFGAPAAPDRV
jgi:hypothetical protein